METISPFTQCRVLQLLGGAAIAAVPAGQPGAPTATGRVPDDARSAFKVDESIGNVYVAGVIDRTYDSTGPIRFRFAVPKGADVRVLATDAGFGQDCAVEHIVSSKLTKDRQRIEIEISVFVPDRTDELPVRVEFVPGAATGDEPEADGMTNQCIKVKTRHGLSSVTHAQA